MHQLLSEKGRLAGLLFNRDFEVSPPFGGNLKEYEQLFQKAFVFNTIGIAGNSVPARTNKELFIEFQKNNFNLVNLYDFEGITCNGCMKTVTTKFLEIDGVMNVSMNNDFSEILIVTKKEIEVKILQDLISYDEKYKINKVK
jgi:copper chaperone CopZ